MLTASTYHGQHYFNRTDSRNDRPRPPSEWIPLAVPAIIDEKTFNAAQALLQSRAPKRVAPRLNDREIRISGSKAVLARSAAAGVAKTTPAVLSFVREWCARQDSNL
ncbi:recombinase family protein [Pseudorhodoplanes sp.]|uniref:recombinase family protein n=1 Tax=Pseudorhodoplanes sp. TaxID=1934341 RepID=UPI0039C97B9A